MKRGLILLALLNIITLSCLINISALDINLIKNQYYPSETLQAEIPDIFITNLNLNNIGIYKSGAVHLSPTNQGLIKEGNNYFFYAVLPQETGNYSLKLEDIVYDEGTGESSEPIIKDFKIVPANGSYISFKPGFIHATSDFTITVKAYGPRQPITITLAEANFEQTFSLGLGSEKTITIPISDINELTTTEISINEYNLPTVINPVIKPVEENQTNYNIKDINKLLTLNPESIEVLILPNKDYIFDITLSTNESIRNITLDSSDSEIVIFPSFISFLEENQTITIIINSAVNLNSSINISGLNGSIILPIKIMLTQNASAVNYTAPPIATCASQGGVYCEAGEECTGIYNLIGGNYCCMGQCEKPKGSTKWIWGVLLLIVLGAGGWYLYKKSKKEGKGSAESIFKKRSDKYEERFNPKITEVRDNLSKI